MQPETRARSLTRVESLLAPEVPVEERQKSLVDIHQNDRPDKDTIAAVVSLLNDPDDSLRTMAEQMLCRWGQQAVTAILTALRSAGDTEVPYRLALLGQLQRMGPTAARAETLLRSLMNDKDIGEAAGQALKAIRLDGEDLIRRLVGRGSELALLVAVVSAPMIAIRMAAPKQAMPPLGMSVGIASLVIVGLMLARVAYADDLLSYKTENEPTPSSRWSIYGVIAVGGAIVGAALGGLCLACGNWAQQFFK
jgi:hypothetical protein